MTQKEPYFIKLTDLAAERLGGQVISCSDDFFAEKENLIKPGRGIFIPDKYTDRGKWMDGWESRRKRVPGYDWAVIKLATSGIIKGLDIDTNHFLGNHPPFASVDACLATEPLEADWVEILPKSPLNPGSQHFFEIKSDQIWNHLRLNIYPDGGVARLKVYGNVHKDWHGQKDGDLIDLAAAINGGRSVCCNDMFFSSKDNIIMPNRGANMGDGWETKRNRTPNNRDWLIIELARPGEVHKVLVDTCHFKGNYPDSCSLEGIDMPNASEKELLAEDSFWKELMPRQKLEAHKEHLFENELVNKGPFTHVRLNIFPDGGISRLRLFGW